MNDRNESKHAEPGSERPKETPEDLTDIFCMVKIGSTIRLVRLFAFAFYLIFGFNFRPGGLGHQEPKRDPESSERRFNTRHSAGRLAECQYPSIRPAREARLSGCTMSPATCLVHHTWQPTHEPTWTTPACITRQTSERPAVPRSARRASEAAGGPAQGERPRPGRGRAAASLSHSGCFRHRFGPVGAVTSPARAL